MLINSGKIVGLLGREPTAITTVSVEMELAREIDER